MKKQLCPIITVFATAVLVVMSLVYQARAAGPKVSEAGNKHNLSASNTGVKYRAFDDAVNNPRGQQICIFCHTPHNANVEGGAPLWNRAFSSLTFSRYSSDTLQIRVNSSAKSSAGYDDSAPAWKPDGSSKLCLSCHDGVETNSLGAVLRGGPISMDPAGGNFISSNTTISWASFNPSTNKMKLGHHPVSFTYDATVRNNINAGRIPTSQVTLPSLAQVKLKNNKMQCTTCHDAHQNQSSDNECYGALDTCVAPDTRRKAPFWVYGLSGTAAGDQQAVCLTCHPMTIPQWQP